jgi:hypothetical protein
VTFRGFRKFLKQSKKALLKICWENSYYEALKAARKLEKKYTRDGTNFQPLGLQFLFQERFLIFDF